MLDQSFSAENFRKIVDLENRKGRYIEGEFFPSIAAISGQLKDLHTELKQKKKTIIAPADYESEKSRINNEIERLKGEKEILYSDKLFEISSMVTDGKFKIQLTKNEDILSKPVYQVAHSPQNIFAFKQLQYNFRKLYKVKQSNRFSIVSHLKNLLEDGFPKFIIRTDIKNFYESIPQKKLLEKINSESLLTHLSRKFIKQIILNYNEISGQSSGVPRGIGISAYLVELFMRDIDSKIRCLPNVMYYARYVDDIVVVFMPSITTDIPDYKNAISQIIIDEGLEVNQTKTFEINLLSKPANSFYKIEYLGYSFSFGYDANVKPKPIPLKVSITKRKKKRYAIRLINAFSSYEKMAKRNEKKARKLFVMRIRFLMSNTRLINNKRNVFTGVYFTNSLVNYESDFKDLDNFFLRKITRSNFPQALKNRLCEHSFHDAFFLKKYSRFKVFELKEIMNNW